MIMIIMATPIITVTEAAVLFVQAVVLVTVVEVIVTVVAVTTNNFNDNDDSGNGDDKEKDNMIARDIRINQHIKAIVKGKETTQRGKGVKGED